MIEVEKKFQPTEEQLAEMLDGAEFSGEIVNHDVYYDYQDYRLFKRGIRLRDRNGRFELKIGRSAGVSEEIENNEDIKKYFDADGSLKEFVDKNFIPIIDYETRRKKYKKDGFVIDVDNLSFGYSTCEIELLVEKEEEIQEAEDKITNFAGEYNFEFKNLPGKRVEYLRLIKPEVYKEIFESVDTDKADIDISVD